MPRHSAPRPSRRGESGTRESRRSWCNRSSVAARNASTSPAASAATSSAARPTLNTASSNGTWSGRSRRALDRRGLAVRDPHHDLGHAAERDAHDVPGRDCDDATVQRRGRVVGVALERGSRPAAPPPGRRGRSHRAARSRRAGPPRGTRPSSRARDRPDTDAVTASGPSPPACRNARTAGCVSDEGSPRSLTSTCRSSATATASNAGPRLADEAGTRTTQSRCRLMSCRFADWHGARRDSRYLQVRATTVARVPDAVPSRRRPSPSTPDSRRCGSTRRATATRRAGELVRASRGDAHTTAGLAARRPARRRPTGRGPGVRRTDDGRRRRGRARRALPGPPEVTTPALELLLRRPEPAARPGVPVRRQSLTRRALAHRVPVRHREQFEELAVGVADERTDADVRLRQHLTAEFRAPGRATASRSSTLNEMCVRPGSFIVRGAVRLGLAVGREVQQLQHEAVADEIDAVMPSGGVSCSSAAESSSGGLISRSTVNPSSST